MKSEMSGIFLSLFAALLPSISADLYVKYYIAVESHGGNYNNILAINVSRR